jgi:hypothetical protein
MSVKIMNMVWDMEMDKDEKLVLLAYADCADNNGGSIYPAVSTIAKKTGYSQRSIQRHTRSLEKHGWLVSDGYGAGRNKTNRWHIPVVEGVLLSPFTEMNSATVMTPLETEKVTSVQEKAPSMTLKGDTIMASFETEKVTPVQERVTSLQEKVPSMTLKGDTVMSPESSLTVINPSINARELASQEIEEITQKEKSRELAELAQAQSRNAWSGREKFPEPIRDLLDAFVQTTGQRPSKGQLTDWLATGQEWLEIGITAADLRAAYARAKPPDGRGFLVTRPGSLTSTAGAIAGERRQTGNPAHSIRDRVLALQQDKE